MAVDDSTSMRENNVNELVDQSLAVLCQSLSSLEVGKFGLVKFGKETEIIQSLQVNLGLYSFELSTNGNLNRNIEHTIH